MIQGGRTSTQENVAEPSDLQGGQDTTTRMSVCDTLPTRQEYQEGNEEGSELRCDKQEASARLEPKYGDAPSQHDAINPRGWAEIGVKPIRNLP